jgi:hypothetical protein
MKIDGTFMTADRLARRLAKLDKGDNIEEFGPRILELMAGCSRDAWVLLDEKPGYWSYMNDRFYMLRRVRNHPEWGRKLFAGLGKR